METSGQNDYSKNGVDDNAGTEANHVDRRRRHGGGEDGSLHPSWTLLRRAEEWQCKLTDAEFSKRMDSEDPLRHFRDLFHYPKKCDLPKVDRESLITNPDEDCIYFCGNSLGLMPKSTTHFIQRELDKWSKMGVYGHDHGELPWQWCDDLLVDDTAPLAGARASEIALMNGLTVNEHLLLISFYQPTKERHKILIEEHAFPSDHYCVESQIRQRGFDPVTSLICIAPREGEHTIRLEDILRKIDEEGDSIAVILFPGVQYFTGQVFDMAAITKAGHSKGCYVGFDLAHAIGNIELYLHDWDVDFACWCSYKYLCSGAGAIAGIFLHERHADSDVPKLTGWWGHRLETRFQMTNKMDLYPGPFGYRLSNPPGLLAAAVQASLQVFSKTSISAIRQKSKLLTAYLEHLLLHYFGRRISGDGSASTAATETSAAAAAAELYVTIITPSDPEERGCQLSIRFSSPILPIYNELAKLGVVVDKREPDVLRVSPVPMYNSFEDVHRFIDHLRQAIEKTRKN